MTLRVLAEAKAKSASLSVFGDLFAPNVPSLGLNAFTFLGILFGFSHEKSSFYVLLYFHASPCRLSNP